MVETTDVFLLTLKSNDVSFLRALFLRGCPFQILDPFSLDSTWPIVKNNLPSDPHLESELKTVDKILARVRPKNWWQSWLDFRPEFFASQLEAAKEEQMADLFISGSLDAYYSLVEEKKTITRLLEKMPGKRLFFGQNLEAFLHKFENYYQNLLVKAASFASKSLNPKSQFLPKIELASSVRGQYLICPAEFAPSLVYFSDLQNIELFDSSEYLIQLEKLIFKISNLLKDKQVNPDKQGANLEERLCQLHANLELEVWARDLSRDFFCLQEGGKYKFAFLAVPSSQKSLTTQILEQENVIYTPIRQDEDLVFRRPNSFYLQHFQNYLSNLGWNTNSIFIPILGLMYAVYFAFGVGDLIYSLVLVLVLGVLLRLKLKRELRTFLGIHLVIAGLAVLWAVLLGRVAANSLSVFGPAWARNFLANFQLLELWQTSTLPLNAFLSKLKLWPAALILLISVPINLGIGLGIWLGLRRKNSTSNLVTCLLRTLGFSSFVMFGLLNSFVGNWINQTFLSYKMGTNPLAFGGLFLAHALNLAWLLAVMCLLGRYWLLRRPAMDLSGEPEFRSAVLDLKQAKVVSEISEN